MNEKSEILRRYEGERKLLSSLKRLLAKLISREFIVLEKEEMFGKQLKMKTVVCMAVEGEAIVGRLCI